MSETPAQPEATTDERDLETLVGEWLTVPDAAERLGEPLS
ncbi:MAG: DNA-binding protein, partial [Dermatophilaceae bacterium]|nr:DNA-binding protein [Dermatophilaceae bacterium]